jgi:hypothetical protein
MARRATFEQSNTAPKLRFRVPAEDGTGDIRLKVEINTREIEAFDPPHTICYRVENPWYAGGADIPTFSREELLATKLRALLQRNKGRDLLDRFQASKHSNLWTARAVECFVRYVERGCAPISRAQAEERMLVKLAAPRFMTGIRPLLSADRADLPADDAIDSAFTSVLVTLVGIMPGAAWAKIRDMKKKFGIL